LNNASYNPYSALTGYSKDRLKEMMEGKKVLIIDPDKFSGFDDMDDDSKSIFKSQYKSSLQKAGLQPGDLIAPADLEKKIADHGDILFKVGGEGIQYMLDNGNLDESLKEAKSILDAAKGAKNIDEAYKKYRALLTLKDNKTQPSELMLQYVPVIPSYLRPVIQEDDKITKDKINDIYSNIVLSSNQLRSKYGEGQQVSHSENALAAARDVASLYRNITNLTGHTIAKDRNTGKEIKGFKTRIGSKEGFIRDKMMSKRVDFSGRSVIGVDPTLKMNEIGLPVDMAKYVYKPFILKELYDQGKAKDLDDAKAKWEKLDNDTVNIIKEVAADRPVLMNRQPTLHKFGIQAFVPKILEKSKTGEEVRNLQLNPLVVTGFNADFDGDTMALHVPVTEKAKEEAKKLMMPSQNLINPTNGSIIIEIRHEMALGIYYLTVNWDKPEGKGIDYADIRQVKKDFMNGAIKARTKINIGTLKSVTAGQAMFLSLLPQQYRGTQLKAWASKDVQGLIRQMYDDAEAGKNGMTKQKISTIIDSIKDLGFMASTKAGASISVTDFKKIDVKPIAEKHIKDLMTKEKLNQEEATIRGWQMAEKDIENDLKKGELLGEDNPVKLMMVSGARAKADQIRRMMVTVGVGRDMHNTLTMPVENSHLDGLAPQEYWLHSHDSRKGMADRSVSTEAPGALTREIWSATQDLIVKEQDCRTTGFIEIKSTDGSVAGRIAAKDIVDDAGKVYVKKGQMITPFMRNEFYKRVSKVAVRSPLRCKTVGGVCQKCYGAIPGTSQLPEIGMAVGWPDLRTVSIQERIIP
jgi:DNA-directed RNA polymerase subunit beta'